MKKRLLSESEIRYIAYKSALGAGIDSETYRSLMREGLGDMLKDLWQSIKAVGGASADAVKGFGQAIKDKKNAAIYADAEKQISDNLDKIVTMVSNTGVGDAEAKAFVKGIVTNYLEKGEMPEVPGSAGGASKNSIAPGSSIAPTKPDAPAAQDPGGRAIIGTAAALTGQPADKAIDAAEKKEITAQQAIGYMKKALAKASGVEQGVVDKSVDHLISNNLLVAGYIRPTTRSLRVMTESVQRMSNEVALMERWQAMAGLLTEVNYNDVMNKLEGGEIKSAEDFKKAIVGMDKDNLEKFQSNKDYVVKVAKEKQVKGFEKPSAAVKTLQDMLKEFGVGDDAQADKELEGLDDSGKKAVQSLVDKKITDQANAAKICSVLFKAAAEGSKEVA